MVVDKNNFSPEISKLRIYGCLSPRFQVFNVPNSKILKALLKILVFQKTKVAKLSSSFNCLNKADIIIDY